MVRRGVNETCGSVLEFVREFYSKVTNRFVFHALTYIAHTHSPVLTMSVTKQREIALDLLALKAKYSSFRYTNVNALRTVLVRVSLFVFSGNRVFQFRYVLYFTILAFIFVCVHACVYVNLHVQVCAYLRAVAHVVAKNRMTHST